ncbi:MAG: DUF6679 family protein [Cyanobacteriota bacterium]|nr:DUF6679 family protein [Cyanobacteriota bacterium]
MLHRKVYQLSREGKDVWIYLRDQGRWLERARILDIEGDTVQVRYETEDEDEICSWEEMVRLDSIGAVAQKLSTIPKGLASPTDLLIADECPEDEMLLDQVDESVREDLEILLNERSSDDHGGPAGELEAANEPVLRLETTLEEGKKSRDSHPDSTHH